MKKPINSLLIKQVHPTKNKSLDISSLSSGSNKKAWWICDKGHEWEATINNRTAGKGCPYCSGLKAIIGENDLFTTNPELKKEWNYKKNINVDPKTIKSGSHIKVWWICDKGHEWEASIYNRNQGTGCPACYKNKRKKE